MLIDFDLFWSMEGSLLVFLKRLFYFSETNWTNELVKEASVLGNIVIVRIWLHQLIFLSTILHIFLLLIDQHKSNYSLQHGTAVVQIVQVWISGKVIHPLPYVWIKKRRGKGEDFIEAKGKGGKGGEQNSLIWLGVREVK